MFDLIDIVHQLAGKEEIILGGEVYKLRNIVAATDGELLKSRFILENVSSIDKIEIDIGISAKVYKR